MLLTAFREFRNFVGTEYKVIVLVLAGLLMGEIGMRCVQDRLSIDVRHLRSFPVIASRLIHAKEHPQVLFLGNSMTRFGISPEAFQSEFLTKTGVHPALVKVNPDNTALADWYYAYRNYFFETGHAPDVLVLGFEGGHLRDKPTNHPGRLAQYYCDFGDWSELCRYDLPTFEKRAEYLLCSVSAMYSNRDRLQRRVLDTLIPGYRDGSQELNARQSSLANRQRPAPTYHRLREFLQMTSQQQVSVFLAAMPIRDEYELDPELLELLAVEDVHLIDCRNIPGIVPAMFPDGVHMTSEASQLYSRFVADEVSSFPIHPSRSLPQVARK